VSDLPSLTHLAWDSRIFDESHALTPHSGNLTHFPAQDKTMSVDGLRCILYARICIPYMHTILYYCSTKNNILVTIYKPAATLNCFKTAWNQWNKCCYICFWAICSRGMYNWLTSGTREKTRGFGWGRFKEQQRRFKTAQKRQNASGAP